MDENVEKLFKVLTPSQIGENRFITINERPNSQRVFGGQVVAQALAAAQMTVSADRHIHSLHNYFILPADPAIAIEYEVLRLRDGGSFTTRQVHAIQNGKVVFALMCSFQTQEDGLEYQDTIPDDIPHPEDLPSLEAIKAQLEQQAPEAILAYWTRQRAFDLLPVSLDHYTTQNKLPARQAMWLRLKEKAPDDNAFNCRLLAYVSDMTLPDTALFAHGSSVFRPEILAASIDHAIWFHRPFVMDDWFLYYCDSPSTQNGRGFNRGQFFSRSGKLIASTAQENLIRLRKNKDI